ncbi:anti-sigma factor domain-containing protein [Paenibacillus sp. GCM10023252]|uniref:anti-sigma factor domain-containing protein n=1 Tax=Paenibacillus sp. GCM10023252 TaxID=3252649 RepID=UPI0036194996
MIHNRCDDVELYMLGGLDEEAKKQVEAHLPHCMTCQRKLEEMRPMMDILPWAVDEAEPPQGMKARILANVLSSSQTEDEEAASLEANLHSVTESRREDQLEGITTAAYKYNELPQRGSGSPTGSRNSTLNRVMTAAAAVLLILSAVLAQRVSTLSQETADLGKQVNELEQQVAAAENPATGVQVNHVVSLSPAKDLVAQGLATIVIDAKGMHLIVQAESLPKLKDNEAFQVWLLKGGKPVNAGTFLTHNGTGALYFTFEPDQYDQIAITLEPDAKGSQPRGSIVLAGPLEA